MTFGDMCSYAILIPCDVPYPPLKFCKDPLETPCIFKALIELIQILCLIMRNDGSYKTGGVRNKQKNILLLSYQLCTYVSSENLFLGEALRVGKILPIHKYFILIIYLSVNISFGTQVPICFITLN